MKYKLNKEMELMLEILKDKILMVHSSNRVGLLCITDFTVIEEEKFIEHIFRPDETIKVKYLTGITIYSYHTDGKFLGTITDDCAERYLNYYNLYHFRQTWIDFREQLRAFDLDVTEIKNDSSSNYII